MVPICEAIGNRQGVADLRVAEFPHAGHNTLGPSFAHAGVRTARVENVRTTTIDRFVKDRGILRLDAIKMDIEGSEYDALTGASDVLNRLRPSVILELSSAGLGSCGRTPDEVLALLADARYRVSRVGRAAELVPLVPGESAPESNIVATPVERPLP